MMSNDYAEEYANLAAKLLERDAASYPLTVERLLTGLLDVHRGVGYAILAGREELAAQLTDLGEVIGTVSDRCEDIVTAVSTVADEAGDLGGSVDILTETLTEAVDNLASVVDTGTVRRRWLRWPFRREVIVVPVSEPAEMPALPAPVPADRGVRRPVVLSAAEADDVWRALADAAKWRTQWMPTRADCDGCTKARASAGERHHPAVAAAASCAAHAEDERLLASFAVLRMRLAGGDPR